MHVLCKNSRLQNPERLADVMAELSQIQWDIVCFSETRAPSETLCFEEGHVLHLSLHECPSAGVGILLHKRFVQGSVVHPISDRILRVDVKWSSSKRLSIFAVYVPHGGYPTADLDDFYELLIKIFRRNYKSGTPTPHWRGLQLAD